MGFHASNNFPYGSSEIILGVEMEKKKILLRLDPKLHEDLRRWAEDDFRSLNAHIEFILKKSIRQNRRTDSSEE